MVPQTFTSSQILIEIEMRITQQSKEELFSMYKKRSDELQRKIKEDPDLQLYNVRHCHNTRVNRALEVRMLL